MFKRTPALTQRLKRTATYEAVLRAKAEEVAQNARSVAPVETGHYRDTIKVDGSLVYTDDVAGHLIEFGSVNNPAFAPLRRGAQVAGLRLAASPKE